MQNTYTRTYSAKYLVARGLTARWPARPVGYTGYIRKNLGGFSEVFMKGTFQVLWFFDILKMSKYKKPRRFWIRFLKGSRLTTRDAKNSRFSVYLFRIWPVYLESNSRPYISVLFSSTRATTNACIVERCGRRFDSLVTGTKLYIVLLGKMLKMVLQMVKILNIRSSMLDFLSTPCGQQIKSIRYMMVMAFLFLKRDEFSSCDGW